MPSLAGTCPRNENFRRKYNRRNNSPANFSHRQRVLPARRTLKLDNRMSGKPERASERTREKEAFFREAARKAVSQVRNATKYLIREFADSFSRVRGRGTSSTKCKGWLRTDGRKERMSYLGGCFQTTPFRRCRRAIFVPRCKSFYKVCVLSLFPKLDTKWIFLFLPRAVWRMCTVYRLSHRIVENLFKYKYHEREILINICFNVQLSIIIFQLIGVMLDYDQLYLALYTYSLF